MPFRKIHAAIQQNIGRVLVGNETAIEHLLVALLSDGHVLIEDVPGVGKTTLAQAFARSLDLSFRRIQFTPDVLPADITGYNIFQLDKNELVFVPGAVMGQLILADEINRSSPKTQSSLLEAMQERQVTVDGTTRELPRPFLVLATQNPLDFAGTFPLPEAQLDRFLLSFSLGYPDHEQEMAILKRHLDPPRWQDLEPVLDQAGIEKHQAAAGQVHVATAVQDYMVKIIARTRQHDAISLGASPRGGIALLRACRSRAYLEGRDFVLPDDVQKMAGPVLLHRLVLRPEAVLEDTTGQRLLRELIRAVPVPAIR